THDLHDHVPVMGHVAVHHAVHSAHALVDGRVVAQGRVGALHVIVDGLGHAHYGKAHPRQVIGHPQGVVTAHGDQYVHLAVFETRQDLVHFSVFDGILTLSA